MQPSIPDPSRVWKRGAVAVWMALSVVWLRFDRLLRDGDEEGHVGAAELFRADLADGNVLGFIERLWVGPMGEYPQAFAATVGTWWWATGVGDPAESVVRAIALISLPVAALATGRIAARLHRGERAAGVDAWVTALVLTVPLCNGLVRHFMPEGALMAVTALAVLSALRWADYPSGSRSVQLGLVLGFGLLTKQTFVFAAVLPVAWAVRQRVFNRPAMAALVALTAGIVAGPWLVANLGPQWSYAGASVAGHGSIAQWSHLSFYPRSTLWVGLGPVLTAVMVWAVVRGQRNDAWLLGMIWLLGGLVILSLIPKKYPRLMAPMLPAAVLLISAALRTHRWRWRGVVAAATAWTVWASSDSLPIHTRSPSVDPGCPQQWLRPPSNSDVGLSAAADLLASTGPGDVLVVNDPAIPCALQTTHDWSNHLGPLLRRRGQERAVHVDPDRTHRYVIEWKPEGGDYGVPVLNQTFTFRDRLGP